MMQVDIDTRRLGPGLHERPRRAYGGLQGNPRYEEVDAVEEPNGKSGAAVGEESFARDPTARTLPPSGPPSVPFA